MFYKHFNITKGKDDALSWKHLQFPNIKTIQNNVEGFCKFLCMFFNKVLCFFLFPALPTFYCLYQVSSKQSQTGLETYIKLARWNYNVGVSF